MFRFRWLNLLLLGFVVYGETIFKSVSGKKGGNVTLKCDFEAREVVHIIFNSQSANIPVCQTEGCARIFKTGSCDVVIKDVSFSDAGKYFLFVYYHHDEAELERHVRTYRLHVHGDVSVRRGASVELDVLLDSADKVQSNSSGEWEEIWSRRDGAQRDGLSLRDGTLEIREFTAGDAGSYVVLDSGGELLITVSVTESRERKAPVRPPQERWSLSKKLCVFFVIWGILVILAVYIFFGVALNF